MNLNKNYYNILGVKHTDNENIIKKAYYKLSFTHHPDKNGDPLVFAEMTEAYDILCSDKRKDYDLKSRFGNNYNEYFEFFEINQEFDYTKGKDQLEKFKSTEVLDIYIKVSDDFNGEVEYERLVKCKTCSGTGKDMSSKILIKDVNGNILKTFDGEDGCDFCEGTGKFMGYDCSFCHGQGKVGLTPCKTCKGDGRILGKQKLSKIKLEKEGDTKIPAMGHSSKTEPGKCGFLVLKFS